MAFQPKRGATLLIPSGPSGNHLFVVVTDELDGEFLLVSVSTIREGRFHDSTCEIDAGVHEFIRDRSYAYYRDARVVHGHHLIAMEQGGVFFAKDDMSLGIVDAIASGVELSDHTPNYAIKFYRKWLRSLERGH
jgi:hypothetical protein